MGKTPLCVAAHRRWRSVCQYFIELGANPNVGRPRFVPLLAACNDRDLQLAEILLSAGADPNGEALVANKPEPDTVIDDEYTLCRHGHVYISKLMSSVPLALAAGHRDGRLTRKLIEAGADVNRLDIATVYQRCTEPLSVLSSTRSTMRT